MSQGSSRSGVGPRRSASARQDAARNQGSTPKPRSKRPKEPRKAQEPVTQVTLKMRESLHRELTKKAFSSGMTMRGFIMQALKQAGLRVTEADLVDGRKRGAGR